MTAPRILALIALGATAAPAEGVDLTKIERSIAKEPAYRSGEPRYGLLVFGPKAETRAWIVLDLGSQSEDKPEDNILYLDRDGDGDLTDPDERIVATMKKSGVMVSFEPYEFTSYSPHFELGDIVERDGTTRHVGLKVEIDSYVQIYRPVSLSLTVAGRGEQWAGGQLLAFADKPCDAPIIHFNGPLTMRLHMSNGVLHVPIDYESNENEREKMKQFYEKHPPRYEQTPLTLGKPARLAAEVGTPGLGRGTFVGLGIEAVPQFVHPVAEVEFTNRDPMAGPLARRILLGERCCGSLFYAMTDAPAEAAPGEVKVTLSFRDWVGGHVAPAEGRATVADPVESGDNRP